MPVCFLFSGLAGLVHEIAWTRLLGASGVSSVFAVSGIVAVFMGGLALGSLLAGPRVDRVRDGRRLLAAYGVLELAVAGLCVAVPAMPFVLRPLARALYRSLGEHFILYNLAALFPAGLLLLIPVACMGATLPVLSRFYAMHRGNLGTRLGRLYGLNTLGAACGALLCGFFLINRLGVRGTVFLASSINGTIGLVCVAFSLRLPRLSLPGEGHAWTPSSPVREPVLGNVSQRLPALTLFAVSGFCGMAVEVIWTRLLAVLIGPTPYSFTIISTCFILGLAAGSLVFGRVADWRGRSAAWLFCTQVAAAILVLGISGLLGNSQFFFAKLIQRRHGSFGALAATETGVLFLLMLGPAACFGAAFPLVAKIVTPTGLQLGRSVGRAYALNAAAAVVGALVAGFVFLPLFGQAGSLQLTAALQLSAAGAIAVWFSRGQRTGGRRWLAGAGLAFAGLALSPLLLRWDPRLLAVGRYQRFGDLAPVLRQTPWAAALFRGPDLLRAHQRNMELLFSGEDATGAVAVTRTTDPLGGSETVLLCSGKPDASTRGDLGTQVLCAHFPLVFHPHPDRVMVLGLGSGITGGETLHYPLKSLDVVEISRCVVQAGKLFSDRNNGVLTDARTRILVQDGRVHLEMTDRMYDVVISEPSNPWMAGMAGLFTHEFFRAVRARLRPGGIFAQWLHSYQMDWATFALVGRTFRAVFPHGTLVATSPRGEDYLLLGFRDGTGLDPETAERNMPWARNSTNVRFRSPYVFFRTVSNESFRGLFGTGPIHTWNRPLLEFAAPLRMFTDSREIQATLLRRRYLSQTTRRYLKSRTTVTARIDFAEFALSVYQPFHRMVDLKRAAPEERRRFLDMMSAYCERVVLDDYSILDSPELRTRCLSAQIKALQTRLKSSPDSLSALGCLGRAHLAADEPRRAIKVFQRVLKRWPDQADIRNDLGTALLETGRIEDAVAEYTHALALAPTFFEAHYNLGNALLRNERPNDAVAEFAKALALDPDDADCHRGLGVAYARLGRLNSAAEEYRKALKIRPDDARTQYNLGNVSLRGGDISGAIVAFRRAVALDRDFAEAWVNLGNACLAAGRTPGAINAYRQALDITPDDPGLRTNLGNALLRQKKVADALEQYRESLDLDPKRPQTHLGLCLAHLLRKEYPLAKQYYRSARKLGAVFPPGTVRLLNPRRQIRQGTTQ